MGSVSAPEVSVIVPLDCDARQALACLAALASQVDAPPHEVIIVHDGSHALQELMTHVDGDVTVLEARPWPGPRAAVDIALEHAHTPNVAVVEEHAVHQPSWLADRFGTGEPEPGTGPELTVVMPTLDVSSDRVRASIRALRAVTPQPHMIVTVDNGWPAQGFTAPVNAGLRAAGTPYVVVMNDDVQPLEGWWPPLRDALDQGAAVAFPRTVVGKMRHDFAAWCFAMTADSVQRFSHAPGQFFDPAMVVWYQDTDLLFRLSQAGCPPVEVPSSHIGHDLSQTVNAPDPRLHAWIVSQINADRITFMAKHPGATLNGNQLAG